MLKQKKQSQKTSCSKPQKKVPVKGRKDFARFLTALDKKVQELTNSIVGLWQNQQNLDLATKSLIASEASLDQQVAVLTRFSIMELNKLRLVSGSDYISEPEINAVFEEWHLLRLRPDAKEHMNTWVLGKSLNNLPELQVKEETTPDHLAGATIFGGDYASDNGNRNEDAPTREDKKDAVSILQDFDEACGEETAGSSDVSELPA